MNSELDYTKIIKTIDDYLIENNKYYILLGQANKLLFEKGIISEQQRKNGTLKKALEKNFIKHAYQTNEKPRQWRIPISDENKLKTISFEKENKKKNNQQSKIKKGKKVKISCPQCGARAELGSHCQNCGTYIPTNMKFKQKPNSSSNVDYKWIIGIIAMFLFLFVKFTENNDNSSSSSSSYTGNYRIVNKDTYGAYTEKDFDLMFDCINNRDTNCLSSLIYQGRIILVNKGTKVSVIDSKFGQVKVRINGTTETLWIVIEALFD